MRPDGLSLVLFKDGKSGRFPIRFYFGACFVGDPTAYVMRGNELVWVVPGDSVSYREF